MVGGNGRGWEGSERIVGEGEGREWEGGKWWWEGDGREWEVVGGWEGVGRPGKGTPSCTRSPGAHHHVDEQRQQVVHGQLVLLTQRLGHGGLDLLVRPLQRLQLLPGVHRGAAGPGPGQSPRGPIPLPPPPGPEPRLTRSSADTRRQTPGSVSVGQGAGGAAGEVPAPPPSSIEAPPWPPTTPISGFSPARPRGWRAGMGLLRASTSSAVKWGHGWQEVGRINMDKDNNRDIHGRSWPMSVARNPNS